MSKLITVSQSCKFCPSEIQSVAINKSICSSTEISFFIFESGENAHNTELNSLSTFLLFVTTRLPVTHAVYTLSFFDNSSYK